ncbi:MAG: hypothetical protein ACYC2H_06595, partial [Thermoplasmatota archaeon]
MPVAAQDPGENPYNELLIFDVEIPDPIVELDINGVAVVEIIIHDLSRDSTGGLAGVQGGAPLVHEVRFSVTPLVDDPGWNVAPPSPIQMHGGESVRTQASFAVIGSTKLETYVANLTVQMRSTQVGETEYQYATIGGQTPGFLTFVATVKDTPQLKPREGANVRVELQNLGLFETLYDFEEVENTCGMASVLPRNIYVGPKGTSQATIEVRAPWREKWWYLSENCSLSVKIYPQGAEDVSSNTVVVTVQVQGQSVMHVEKLAPIVLLALFLWLLLLLLARRKARVEEEILGKPQKPWTIPVEVLYLSALRKKDARAWYVVRHYLMEDEYRSSLLWYKSYKKQTKGSRKKESLVLRQEKAYEGWKKAWAKDIEKPIRKADRFEVKLQRKLDKKADKAHRKQLSKYRAVTVQMEKAHAKQVERASEKYEKAAAKARKKGQPLPDKPTIPKPDYPEEPELVPIALAEHKWAKKAARFRARQVRRQGDLEVKFEKADARRLAKVRRKVQKMARKLDDPEFVAEHPL